MASLEHFGPRRKWCHLQSLATFSKAQSSKISRYRWIGDQCNFNCNLARYRWRSDIIDEPRVSELFGAVNVRVNVLRYWLGDWLLLCAHFVARHGAVQTVEQLLMQNAAYV
jgi:hypothetical protein